MANTYSIKKILEVAWPIVVGGVFTNMVTVVDTAFLGRLGPQQIGGAGNAGILFFICVLVGSGLTTGAQIIMARRNGEQRFDEIGSVFFQTALSLFLLFLGFMLFIHTFGAGIIRALTQSSDIYQYIMEYLNMRSWGLIFYYFNALFIAFYVATTKTKIIGIITPIIACTNILLDYLLIQGNYGFPALGVKGAALASNLSEILGFTLFLSFSIKARLRLTYQLFHKSVFTFSGSIQRILFQVGGPVMAQNFLSIAAWFAFFMSIEKMGETDLAISHIIRSIYIFLMIPIFALGNTTNTLVSNLIGMDKAHEVKKLIFRIWGIGLLACLILFSLLQISPESVLNLFTSDQFLINYSTKTYHVIAYAVFFLCTGMIWFNAVSGTGKTRLALYIELLNVAVYLGLVYLLTQVYQVEIHRVWYTEFVYFTGLFGLSVLFFIYYPWRKKTF